MEFEPGETTSLTVKQWLDAAGVSLDERLESGVDLDEVTGHYPFRRFTGQKLRVMFRYYGDENDEEVKCEIRIWKQDGWNSLGSEELRVKYDSTDSNEYYDFYKRGIRFEFITQGRTSVFDFQMVLNRLVAGLVSHGCVNVIVGIVAFYLLPERQSYKSAHTEKCSCMAERSLTLASILPSLAMPSNHGTIIKKRSPDSLSVSGPPSSRARLTVTPP